MVWGLCRYDTRQWGDTFNNIYSAAMKEYFSRDDVNAALHTGGIKWQNGDGTAAPNPVAIKLQTKLMSPVRASTALVDELS